MQWHECTPLSTDYVTGAPTRECFQVPKANENSPALPLHAQWHLSSHRCHGGGPVRVLQSCSLWSNWAPHGAGFTRGQCLQRVDSPSIPGPLGVLCQLGSRGRAKEPLTVALSVANASSTCSMPAVGQEWLWIIIYPNNGQRKMLSICIHFLNTEHSLRPLFSPSYAFFCVSSTSYVTLVERFLLPGSLTQPHGKEALNFLSVLDLNQQSPACLAGAP